MSDLLLMLSHGPGLVGIVVGVAIGLRAVASILCAWIEQAALTRRFDRALEGSKPSERARIIKSVLGGGQKGTGKHESGR